MSNRYLVLFGFCLELLAALWLIGNPNSPRDAMLAFLLHLIAAICLSMGTPDRLNATYSGTGKLALFCLAFLLPLVGPLVYTMLTSNAGGGTSASPTLWYIVEPGSLDHQMLKKKKMSTTALSALIKHSNDKEAQLSALRETSELGPRAARPILRSALNDKSELIRKTAFELLEGRNTSVYQKIGSLLEVMDNNPASLNDTQIQAEAASQLWELSYQGLADPEAVNGFLERANAHLHRAMRTIDPPSELYFQRGRIQLKLNHTAAARNDFEQAIALGQSNDEVLPYLAECAYLEKRYDLILPCLKNLTPIRQHSGRFSKVIEIWSEAV